MFCTSKLPWLILLMVFVAGCKPRDKIATYEVEKSSPREAVDVDAIAKRFDHMLAAVVPQGKQAWFFKLVAPAEVARRHKEEFVAFLQSIQLNESTEQKPTWKIPEKWEEKPGTGMRAATLVVPDESGPLELTVTLLPQSGAWDDYVADNVNRWLRQLQQSPLDKKTIKPLLKKASLPNEAEATWVELVGTMSRQDGMSGRLPSDHPPIASSPAADSSPPNEGNEANKKDKAREENNVRPATTGPPASSPASPLAYETPDGWSPGPVGGMRKAAFQVSDGEAQAEVTVIDLPSTAPGITDVDANFLRWARQVGLVQLDKTKLSELIEPIEIDDLTGKQTMLLGPAEAVPSEGLLGAMVEREGKVWFFKMKGDRQLVESQRPVFTRFVESVHFK